MQAHFSPKSTWWQIIRFPQRRTEVLIATVCLLVAGTACKQERPEDLATRHCSTCHLFPAPSLLDKTTWKSGVLPEMALRMGLDISELPGTNAKELNEILHSLPPAALVSEEEWQIIQDYYVSEAPDTLETIEVTAPRELEQFSPEPVSLPISAGTSLTVIQSSPKDESIYVGTREGKLLTLGSDLTIKDAVKLPSPPSRIYFPDKNSLLVVCMGIMDPNDQPAGSIMKITGKNVVETVVDSIKRPVFLEKADFNNDHLPDMLVSSFGNFTGGLLLFENAGGGTYKKHFLHNFPGTRKTITRDFNGDGLVDIFALLTQGDERIALFTNRGNLKFSYQVLLKFPPVYGSSYFELVDFNGDGKDDILYTNGDNADYSPVLKPYHGVRIFINDGKNQFKESWFYPMHGASMAIAADFDEDGDPDIAAISFFPDFLNHPDHSFIYLRNDGKSFTSFSTPLASTSRWITMEATDIDDDGDRDIMLGALAFATGVPDSLFNRWMRERISLLILKNNLR